MQHIICCLMLRRNEEVFIWEGPEDSTASSDSSLCWDAVVHDNSGPGRVG